MAAFARVVWLGTRQRRARMLQLANMLRADGAQAALLSKPAKTVSSAYHPPARRPPRGADPAAGFCWQVPVNEFVLYESNFIRGRTRYNALERYPFTVGNSDAVHSAFCSPPL